MFIYLTNCPDKILAAWQAFYVNLLTDFSPAMIIQHVFNINKKSAEKKEIEYEVSEILLERIDSIVDLQHRNIEMFTLSLSDLEKSDQLNVFYEERKKCLNNLKENTTKNWSLIKEDMKNIG